MPRRPSARRYASALYQLALERGAVERWQADLQAMDEALQEREFAAFLGMPKIRLSQKMSVIREGLPQLDPLVHNLLGLLISRDMVEAVSSLRDEYGKLVDRQHGRERAHVISAVPLAAGHRERLARYLEELMGKEIEMTTAVDPSILAGLVARVGDRLIDGSAKTRLQELKKSLAEAAY
ncbi:MAG: ATP synthase F1 subunit delta [Chloroflexi bacterium]|nr:ATP synthase F1 subunit delta [Chloroflexota bacterium]